MVSSTCSSNLVYAISYYQGNEGITPPPLPFCWQKKGKRKNEQNRTEFEHNETEDASIKVVMMVAAGMMTMVT
jgi:hypothetical protein